MAIAAALEEDENKIQKKRKYSVHPLNKERKRKGQFHLICMSMPTLDELLSIVKSDILKMENFKNDTITPEERLTITI
ncbi:protein ANTAGONIST OF LIKE HETEROCHROMATIN PROTEIN 1-like [Aphis craccivora]|uniref:Protein ANTAGONIST OF LIKE HETEROCHROMATIN PROTEIN 1-like n=1 Tax=Aphis craccivora TaxID=307492 RepID=A0A6G0ZKM2_APHCR|nr:protein ANTAGONIST OF LIKE HETEROCHROMATIN PROTEIN 1-like [Aphis craccivora]